MSLGAVSPVYSEENLISGCIKSLEPFIEEHIICVSEKPYFGEREWKDNTGEVAEDLGASVIYGDWELDHHQRNTGISLLQEHNWIITTDVDMWITKPDLACLIAKLDITEADAFIIKQKSYWKDIDHVLVGDDFMPVIAIRPHVRFKHIGNVNVPCEIVDDIEIHHLNWCEPKDILKKVLTYPHAPEFNGLEWYEKHYKTWKEGDDAVLPTSTFKVKRDPLPDELREYINFSVSTAS